jgi:hypothetical protein
MKKTTKRPAVKKLPKGPTLLCLRTVKQDGTSYGGFSWPKLGYVEVPDFSPETECGHGLHGYLRGCGDGDQIDFDGLFQVVKVLESEVIDLDDKVKFLRCEVILTGSQQEATTLLLQEYPGLPIIGAGVVVGNHGVAVVGYRGTATAGKYGTASAGYKGTASAGDYGTASAGYRGTASAGYGATASAGDCGTASAGDYGTASAGDGGTASAGHYGTASAGDGGTASAGNDGTASAGDYGTASAGDGGTASAGHYGTASAGSDGIVSAGKKGRLSLLWLDYTNSRYREEIAYVGENGIEPNVKYKLDDQHRFIKA